MSECCIKWFMKSKSIAQFSSVTVVLFAGLMLSHASNAAEWKTEPSVALRAEYNDNVRMRPDQNNPESSTGFTLDPRLILSGEELNLWDVKIDARGRITRFQDIEDADSENAFFVFDGGRQTELTDWRLNTSFERNSNFDTDYDTQSPDAGLLDDHTERKTATVAPSLIWSTSETSQLSFRLTSIDVSYDEVTSLNIYDYDYGSAQLSMFWQVAENHQLGFSGSYAEYDSPEAEFSWDNTELAVDYTYIINQTSNLSLSVGGRKLESLAENQVTGCVGGVLEFNFTNGLCTFSSQIIEDVPGEDTGTVTDLSYTKKSERVTHSLSGGRTVIPSSFGSAQEQLNFSYQFYMKNTERLTTNLILDASQTETLSGVDSSNDRTRYRFEPEIRYKLTKNWNLNFTYRYIDQNITNSDEDSTSNAVFINLYLSWPKLATTY